MSDYGKKGGTGPNTGKKAQVWLVTLPDGTVYRKKVFKPLNGDELIATGFPDSKGRPLVVVWDGEPQWEGDYGRLVARREQ